MIVFNKEKFAQTLEANIDDLAENHVISRHQYKLYTKFVSIPRLDTYIRIINALNITDMNHFFLQDNSASEV